MENGKDLTILPDTEYNKSSLTQKGCGWGRGLVPHAALLDPPNGNQVELQNCYCQIKFGSKQIRNIEPDMQGLYLHF